MNILPTKVLNGVSLCEQLFGHKPDYQRLRVFECLCYPHLRPFNRHKLQYRSKQFKRDVTTLPIFMVPTVEVSAQPGAGSTSVSNTNTMDHSDHSLDDALDFSSESPAGSLRQVCEH
ncbi:hypothetical protein ES288_A04G114800v1 [Gossypium darwinii]|uniref:Uncharacterized protein n=1 Tax=Gossypium darwinii TaxID=34276 RepID=A0A5D2GXC6_GOSDA|nr:hypothetical protein ES288_A04G114800v1 [Gossypium darwinii]